MINLLDLDTIVLGGSYAPAAALAARRHRGGTAPPGAHRRPGADHPARGGARRGRGDARRGRLGDPGGAGRPGGLSEPHEPRPCEPTLRGSRRLGRRRPRTRSARGQAPPGRPADIRSSTAASIARRAARRSSSSCREDGVRYSAISRRSARPGTRSTSPAATSRSHSRLAEDRIIFSCPARPRRLMPSSRSTTISALSCGPGQPRRGLLAGRVPRGSAGLARRRRPPRRASGPAHPAHGVLPWCSRDYPYGRHCRRG